MHHRIKCATAIALTGVMAAPAAAQQQRVTGPKADYWVSAETATGFAAMGAASMMSSMGGMTGGGMAGGGMGPGGMPSPGAMAGATAAQMGASAAGRAIGGAGGAVVGGVVGGLMGGLMGRRSRPPQQAQAPRPGPAAAPAPARPANFVRTLSLVMGSNQKPPNDPTARHQAPPGLQRGAALPLVAQQENPSLPTVMQPRADGTVQRPKGKMLIYWGCGEHAAAPPITIDFATLAPGRMPNIPTITVNTGTPPSKDKHPVISTWPNSLGQPITIAASDSLVGDHTVRGDTTPEIRFSLDQAHDFLAPLHVNSSQRSPAGGQRLTWPAIPNATGYFAQVVGAQPDQTMVMWSSSATPAAFGQMLDYVPPAEVRRLIGTKVVMPPTQTECIVPVEVVRAAPQGMLMMIAYGDEVNAANPPRPARPAPWNIEWTTKVRFKSTHTNMLGGMPGM